MLLKNKLSPQAIRNFHHKIRIFIIKDELLQFSKTNQVISQNVDRLRLVLPFLGRAFLLIEEREEILVAPKKIVRNASVLFGFCLRKLYT